MTTISVGDLLHSDPGTKKVFKVDLPVFKDDEVTIQQGQEVEVEVYKIDEGVSASLLPQAIKGKSRCNTCLKDFDLDIDLYLGEKQYYLKMPDSITEDEEFNWIDKKSLEIDVTELLREGEFLNLPPVLKCSEECKGICSSCGEELNKGDCECEKSDSDTIKPFANLKEMMGEDEN